MCISCHEMKSREHKTPDHEDISKQTRLADNKLPLFVHNLRPQVFMLSVHCTKGSSCSSCHKRKKRILKIQEPGKKSEITWKFHMYLKHLVLSNEKSPSCVCFMLIVKVNITEITKRNRKVHFDSAFDRRESNMLDLSGRSNGLL